MPSILPIANRSKLPQSPGVYLFRDGRKRVLYVGRATNLRSRVASYFSSAHKRGEWIAKMAAMAKHVSYEKTDTVLESVILEANLIRKLKSKYNTDLKDDKSFTYIAKTKEEFPRFVFVREREALELQRKPPSVSSQRDPFPNGTPSGRGGADTPPWKRGGRNIEVARLWGPYTSKRNAEIVLKILRRIFPFHSSSAKSEKGCLDFQIGLCPGPYAGAISKEAYRRNIRNIEYVLAGKRSRLLATLEREMKQFAKDGKFEEAAKTRDELFALRHIRDTALMGRDSRPPLSSEHYPPPAFGHLPPRRGGEERVEAYDISHIAGEYPVASMVVFRGGEPEKSAYRKFTIKTIEGINDIAMMREVLARRLRHAEWEVPDAIVLDGGAAHLAMAEKLFVDFGVSETLGLLAVAKGPTRKNVDVYASSAFVPAPEIAADKELLEALREEAHRFAISFHRKRRGKGFLLSSNPPPLG